MCNIISYLTRYIERLKNSWNINKYCLQLLCSNLLEAAIKNLMGKWWQDVKRTALFICPVHNDFLTPSACHQTKFDFPKVSLQILTFSSTFRTLNRRSSWFTFYLMFNFHCVIHIKVILCHPFCAMTFPFVLVEPAAAWCDSRGDAASFWRRLLSREVRGPCTWQRHDTCRWVGCYDFY